MDLSTVNKKLINNLYSNIKEVVQDIDLIWCNCQLYNGEEAPISQMAVKLKKLSSGLFKKIFGVEINPAKET